jgi:hypothetical protein
MTSRRHSDPDSPGRPLHRRPLFWVLAIVVVVVAVALGAWRLSSNVLGVKHELERAQALAGDLKTQATAFDLAGADATLDEITKHTGRAVELSGDPVWSIAQVLPVLGPNLSAVRQISVATDDAMTDVAAPLLEVATTIGPAGLAPKDGVVDLHPLVDAGPAVTKADASVKRISTYVSRIDTDGAIDQVASAKTQLTELLGAVSPIAGTLNAVVPLLPPALGSEAPRKYLVMFQNNAELRPLGGAALSFAVLNVDGGRIQFEKTIPISFSDFTSSEPVIPLPDGVAELYRGTVGTYISDATARPSFTTAATVVQEMWKRNQGYAVDGILSVDPVALSYVLRATGPITLSTGDVLTSDSLVPLLLNGVYQRFDTGDLNTDGLRQDAIYAEAVDATFGRLMSGPLDVPTFVGALSQGWNERRIAFWSAHEEEQKRVVSLAEPPVSDAKTERVGLYLDDGVGAKLNYYLQQSVQLSQGTCRADGATNYRVATTLVNTLPFESVRTLTGSVTGTFWKHGLAPGQQRLGVTLYAPPGSRIVGATVDGAAVAVDPHHDTDYPVARLEVSLQPGKSATVSYDVVAASAGSKVLEAQLTPTVNPVAVETVPLDCATVPAE